MIINVLYITPPENYYENGKPTILKMYLWLEMVMFQPVMFVFFLGGVDTSAKKSKPQTPYLQTKVPVPTSRCNEPNRSSTDSAPARPSTSVLAATCRNFTSNRFSELVGKWKDW